MSEIFVVLLLIEARISSFSETIALIMEGLRLLVRLGVSSSCSSCSRSRLCFTPSLSRDTGNILLAGGRLGENGGHAVLAGGSKKVVSPPKTVLKNEAWGEP